MPGLFLGIKLQKPKYIKIKATYKNTPNMQVFYVVVEEPSRIPVTFNSELKRKLTLASICIVYAAFFIEYCLNPHSFYQLNGVKTIMPPCMVLETYISYNIFVVGVPLAVFLHIKMSNYQYFGYYGILATLEFAMAAIILAFDKIRSIHGSVTLMLLIITGIQIVDHELDSSTTLYQNIKSGRAFYSIAYFSYLLICAIALSAYWEASGVEQGHLDNVTNTAYILTMVVWIAVQWLVCVVLSDKPPYGLDFKFGILFILLSALLVALSNEFPQWHAFALNKKRPWES